MIDIAEKIEEKIKEVVPTIDGIIGWVKYFKPATYPAYCIEVGTQEVRYERISTYATDKPVYTIYYIDQMLDENTNPDTRNFLKESENIINKLKEDLSLGGLVTKFEMRTKPKTRDGDIKENIFEIKINIMERRD